MTLPVVDFGHAGPSAGDLHAVIDRVCPIDGVRIGRWQDRSTWGIDFRPEATPEQMAAAWKALSEYKLQDNYVDMGAPVVIA